MMTSPTGSIRVSVNGESRSLRAPMSVDALLTQLGVDRRVVAVERNRAIVSKDAFATTALVDGDALEIVSFVGGG